LTEEVETELKEAAVISMGTEIGELDLANIRELCDQVLSLSEYRAQLYDYLKSRMNTIAPNLTAMVGELVGARLIAHGGSLINLAKQPGSTVQILGAEKALFRALKTKHATPKYGLIYHASLIGQAAPKFKGKISRSLAAKTALAIRCDALGDGQDNTMGLENRAKVLVIFLVICPYGFYTRLHLHIFCVQLEARLRNLEGKELGRFAGSAKGKPKIEAYDKDRKKGAGGLITPAKVYLFVHLVFIGTIHFTQSADCSFLCRHIILQPIQLSIKNLILQWMKIHKSFLLLIKRKKRRKRRKGKKRRKRRRRKKRIQLCKLM